MFWGVGVVLGRCREKGYGFRIQGNKSIYGCGCEEGVNCEKGMGVNERGWVYVCTAYVCEDIRERERERKKVERENDYTK